MVVTPVGEENWWDKLGVPQYGGSFTFRWNRDPVCFDPYQGPDYVHSPYLWFESLGMNDWVLDRGIFSYNGEYVPPKYRVGCLAESWEEPDSQTIIFHVRKGIHFQDKPLVNGRELTAYDIEYTWGRQFALAPATGFTKPSHYVDTAIYAMIESVTATDKYTVVYKARVDTIKFRLI